MAASTKLLFGVHHLILGAKSSLSLNARPTVPLLQFSRWFVQSSGKFPSPPKKPGNAYIRYVTQKRSSVKLQNPGADARQIVRICASMWKQLSDTERQPYFKDAAVEREKYKSEFEDFKSDFTIEEWQEYQDSIRLRKLKLKRRRKRGELHQLGKPKLPANAYSLFVKDMLSGATGNMQEHFRDMTGQWASLPEAERQRYMSEASRGKEKYEKQMQAWEKRMVELGRPELVRGYKAKKTTTKKKKPTRKVAATKATKKAAKVTRGKIAAKKTSATLSASKRK